MEDPNAVKIEKEVTKTDDQKQENELSAEQMEKIAGGGLVVGTL
jgi:hypothetical protein